MARAEHVIRGLRDRNGGTVGLVALCAVLALGLGLRLSYAWDGWSPVADAQAYAALAANLEQKGEYTQQSPEIPQNTQEATNYSPGLPLFIAGLYEVRGKPDERLARVVLALIASSSVLFTYLIGRRLAGPLASLLGAVAVAIYPAFLEYGGMLMTEPLAAALLSGSILAILWASDRESLAAWILPALALGATAMVRPEYLAVGFMLAVVVLALRVRAEPKAAYARAALLLAGMAVIVAPWTIRNYVVLDRFVPISTGGGQVLFAGTYLPSGGDPEKVGAEVLARHPGLIDEVKTTHGAAGQPPLESILAALAAREHPGVDSDIALAKMGRRQLLRDIRDDPVETAGFIATKVGRVWGMGPRTVMKQPVWRAFHFLILIPALAGLILLGMRRRREAAVIGIVVLTVTGISALTVASPRRVLVVMPLVAAVGGYGAVELARLAAGRAGPSAPDSEAPAS